MRLLVGETVAELAVTLGGVVVSSVVIGCKSSKRKVDDVVNDDVYDGIKRLYAEDGSTSAADAVAAVTTCAGEVLRCPPGSLQLHDFVTRVNN